jgi:Mor family transcriptional regulator
MDKVYPLPEKKERNEQVARDYNDGVAIDDIAIKHRVKPQRIWQILKKQGVKANRAKSSVNPS